MEDRSVLCQGLLLKPLWGGRKRLCWEDSWVPLKELPLAASPPFLEPIKLGTAGNYRLGKAQGRETGDV